MTLKNIVGCTMAGGIISIIVINTVLSLYQTGIQPVTYASGEIEEEERVVLIEVHPTALNRIADCESGERTKDGKAVPGSARQFNKDGTVLIGQHTPAEEGIDLGWAQINTKYHLERALSLGIDLFTEEGNKKYARLLYKEQGAAPWSASRNCHGEV